MCDDHAKENTDDTTIRIVADILNPTADLDGYSEEPGRHWSKSLIIGEEGPFVQRRSHSFLGYLGPQCYILLLDCRYLLHLRISLSSPDHVFRGERSKEQVCSKVEYDKVFERLDLIPPNIDHLVVQLGIPIAYPRMVFLESALESKLNPLVALGRTGSLGLSGFVNKFNAEAELLDDLNDHWTAKIHKKERNYFIQRLQDFALRKRKRVTFLSGDVHCAAVGILKTLRTKGRQELTPPMDYRYMVNIVTSKYTFPFSARQSGVAEFDVLGAITQRRDNNGVFLSDKGSQNHALLRDR
ncbi:hypothetical protein H0H93_007237 [Arthromyces matolae]|nr:hypothetical protein H0H93_007237 [Arthromyces matolae]